MTNWSFFREDVVIIISLIFCMLWFEFLLTTNDTIMLLKIAFYKLVSSEKMSLVLDAPSQHLGR